MDPESSLEWTLSELGPTCWALNADHDSWAGIQSNQRASGYCYVVGDVLGWQIIEQEAQEAGAATIPPRLQFPQLQFPQLQ